MKFTIHAAIFSILLLGAGCGGMSASHSVSPASLFLPGLMQIQPSATNFIAVNDSIPAAPAAAAAW